jgi:endonuclease G
MGNVVAARCSRTGIEALLEDSGVIALEESRVVGAPGDEEAGLECDKSLPFLKIAPTYATAGGAPYEEKGDHALVAIIDNGIDVLHEAFLDEAGRSRIVGIWDQRARQDGLAHPPAGFTYGTEHTRQDIAKYVSEKAIPPSLDRNVMGHGTHVASIAAGRAAGTFLGGVAPSAAVLVVITGNGDAIGYSTAHVDALQYIARKANELQLPVVVNLSQGMNAGAHDGRSLLEAAFDSFSHGGRDPGRVIVKSAGNERGKNAHASVAIGTAAADSFEWTRKAPPSSRVEREHVEIWYDSANDWRFRLMPPGGPLSLWVDEASPSFETSLEGGAKVQVELVKRHPDNGDDLLRLDITGPNIPSGTWTVELESLNTIGSGVAHAWIERTSDHASAFLNHIQEGMTVTIPGTATNVITVGAVATAFPLKVPPFSSFGPTRTGGPKPDVAAPGVDIKAAAGGTAQGVRAESGTSMAAPHVAGAIALVLSKRAKRGPHVIPSSTQISAALRQKVLKGNGQWTAGVGYGVPDVAALLAAFP